MDGYNKIPNVDNYEENIKKLEKLIQKNLDGMVNEYYEQLDFFKNLKLSEADKEKIIAEANRRIRRKRIMRGAVVAAILVCICTGLLYFTVEPGTADRESIQNRLEYDENSGIVSGTFGDNDIAELNSMTYSEADIEDYKRQYNQLLLPANIPEEYEFDYLQISNNSEMFSATYRYVSGDQELLISQTENHTKTDALGIYNQYDKVETSVGTVYVQIDEVAERCGGGILYNENCQLTISLELIENNRDIGLKLLLPIFEGMLN